jgi:uncharacterized protein YmfQ (DUF2313 family)
MTADDYRRQMQALLPRGFAWPLAPAAWLTRLLSGLSPEFARIHGRVLDLIRESDPRTTVEMLAEWERALGLPDNCSSTLAPTLQARRDDVLTKLVSLGGQSREYFIAVAARLGYTISIEEFKPFRVGRSRVGESINALEMTWVWRVNGPPVTIRSFRVGRSRIGERLRSWGNTALECRLTQLKPAHTKIIFSYPDANPPPPGG